jgi:hypothetical protein
MTTKSENWKGRGRVSVSRDARGRFAHWELIKNLFEPKSRAVSVYGRCRTTFGEYSARYDFEYGSQSTGSINDVKKAIAYSFHFPPKRRFVTVGASEFLRNPFDYGTRGYWVSRPDIDS